LANKKYGRKGRGEKYDGKNIQIKFFWGVSLMAKMANMAPTDHPKSFHPFKISFQFRFTNSRFSSTAECTTLSHLIGQLLDYGVILGTRCGTTNFLFIFPNNSKIRLKSHINALLELGILGIGTQRCLLLIGLSLTVSHG
jgi:hypothetical protein